MESIDLISKILDGKIVLGKKEDISEDTSLIPVYKAKITYLNVNTDIKNNSGDALSGNINITPMCLLKIKKDDVEIIYFNLKESKENFSNVIPDLMANLDINNLLKNIKI